ncbi:CBL-interacting serine/threonine-protein kinase 8, partial [Clydaea vesicula]
TFCGTPNYAAVELISGIPYVGVKSDIWAMGVVLFVLTSGNPPFFGTDLSSLYSKIKAIDYRCPEYFSPSLKQLIAKILVKDPLKRITMDSLRQDEWVNYEEVEMPLRILPKLVGNDDLAQISQFIAGITSDKNAIIYLINNHVTINDENNHNSGQQNFLNSKILRKIVNHHNNKDSFVSNNNNNNQNKSSSNSQNMDYSSAENSQTNSINVSSKENNEDDGLSPLGRKNSKRERAPSLRVRSNSNGADLNSNASLYRRRSSAAGKVQIPNRSRSTSTTERPVTVARRMSMTVSGTTAVGKDSGTVNNPSTTPLPRRASIATNMITPVNIAAKPPMVGTNLVKSPSMMVEDKDPFSIDDEEDVLTVPTTEEILDWHVFHKPPKEVRTVRFSFNNNTTSSFEPANIFRELHRVILEVQTEYPNLVVKRMDEYYMVHCILKNGESGKKNKENLLSSKEKKDLIFEIEICKVWLLKIHGLRFKKLKGDAFMYKSLYQNIVENLQI